MLTSKAWLPKRSAAVGERVDHNLVGTDSGQLGRIFGAGDTAPDRGRLEADFVDLLNQFGQRNDRAVVAVDIQKHQFVAQPPGRSSPPCSS